MKDIVINFRRWQIRRPPQRFVWPSLSALAIALLCWDGISQVNPDEVGVVLRHGRHVRTVQPGLRLEIPFIERMVLVPVQRQLIQEFGSRRTADSSKATEVLEESMMLSGDLNVVDVEWIVQYQISDPYKYLFKVRDAEGTLRDLNEAVVSEVIGDRTVTEVLTVGRLEIEAQVRERLQTLATRYDMGISIEQIALQDVSPPASVKPAWDEVTQAQQQLDRRTSDARAEYNRVIPGAIGLAQQRVLEADGDAIDRVTRAQGDATRFTLLYEAYRRDPDVTKERLYLESMTRILEKVGNKFILDSDAKGIVPLIAPADVVRALESAPAKKDGGNK